MRCGMTLFIQGYEDWDRYLARERGEDVPDLDPELDRRRLSGEIETMASRPASCMARACRAITSWRMCPTLFRQPRSA